MSTPAPAAAAAGWLALVATPIGNLEDITYRAVRILREAEVIAAEDTRRARILLQHYGIDHPLTSYHSFNEHHKTAQLIEQVRQGRKLAVLSDAGTPCLNDPGYLLVRDALAAGLEPLVIPGVSALTHAVVAAGLPMSTFVFGGFLPVKPGRRRTRLRELTAGQATLILYESPFRINRLLSELAEVLGGETPVALLREATKLHEECLRGSAAELLAKHGQRTWKGEFTVVVWLRALSDG